MHGESRSVQTVRVSCTCGHDHIVANMDRTVECACGRVFAVTVSEIFGPDDDRPSKDRDPQDYIGP